MHPIRDAWKQMKYRCDKPEHTSWQRYGGRGIKYCLEWANYPAFERDMRPAWKEGLYLDRRDNDGNYTPENCRWVTPTESARNRSSTKISLEKAIEVRRLYAGGGISQRGLGKLLGIDYRQINLILKDKHWKE